MSEDPYSRLYWRVLDEFPVLGDDATFGLYCRLLTIADAAWPSSAYLPGNVNPKRMRILLDAGLIENVAPWRYRIRGMDKHRNARSDAARSAVNKRWQYARNTDVSDAGYGRRNGRIPSRAEPRQDEPMVRMTDVEQREHLDSLKDVMAQAGIPTNGATPKPYTDDEQIAHLRAVRDDAEQPDWKRKAAADQLTAMRVDMDVLP